MPDDRFRSGNYHFFGGALLASELMLRGHDRLLGIRLPVFISEALGGVYKRLTMESSYLSDLERKLFRFGYPGKEVPRPADVSEAEFERAKYQIRLNLLHLELTHEQHRMGAEWAYQIIRSHARAVAESAKH